LFIFIKFFIAGNEIMEISSEQLRGVSKSLINLILANNGLTVLPAGVFSTLQLLENLDLSGNALATFNPASFTPPPPKLIRLNLADNLFEIVPYKELLGIR
jgi:Leucine-rich repeat (LRR) protein